MWRIWRRMNDSELSEETESWGEWSLVWLWLKMHSAKVMYLMPDLIHHPTLGRPQIFIYTSQYIVKSSCACICAIGFQQKHSEKQDIGKSIDIHTDISFQTIENIYWILLSWIGMPTQEACQWWWSSKVVRELEIGRLHAQIRVVALLQLLPRCVCLCVTHVHMHVCVCEWGGGG